MQGFLVLSKANDYGIGKILETDGTMATVEYFVSPNQQFIQRIDLNKLSPQKLHSQTRCYVRNGDGVWQAGLAGTFVRNVTFSPKTLLEKPLKPITERHGNCCGVK